MPSKHANSKISQYKITWEEYDKSIRILANKIKKSKQKFSVIYTFKRGGLPIATHLSHLLKINRIEIDKAPLWKENTLIVDDISDTGETLEGVITWRKYLRRPYKLATLHRKSGTKVEPNYYVKTINKWIVYPWEV